MNHLKPDSSPQVSRILVVDDHPLIREGIAARLAVQPDMEVCGEAIDVAGALAQVAALRPDLVIIDIQLSESHGMDLINQLHAKYPDVKMLVVSAYDDSLYAERVLRAGAEGYVNKRELQDNIITALRAVLAGKVFLGHDLSRKLALQAVGHPLDDRDPIERLSNRELQVFELIGQGHTTRAIARQLNLSIHTIDTHREKIRHKLSVANSTELLHQAVQWVLEKG